MFLSINKAFGINRGSKKFISRNLELLSLEQRITPATGVGTGTPTILTQGTALVTEYPLQYPGGPYSGSTHELVNNWTANGVKDNTYWGTGMTMDYIYHFDGNTNTAQYYYMGMNSMPHGIIFDAAGHLYVSLEGTGTVSGKVAQINTSTGAINFTVDLNYTSSVGTVNQGPHPLAVDPDGVTIWFTGKNTSTVGHLNLVNGAITAASTVTSYPLSLYGTPIYIEAGGDNRMWGTELTGNKIFAVTTSTNGTPGIVSEYTIPTANSRPIAITRAPSGTDMYFTEEAGNNIGRITAAGVITEFAVPPSQSDSILASLAFDSNGNIYTQSYVNQGTGTPLQIPLSHTGPDYIVRLSSNILTAQAISGTTTGDNSNILYTRYQAESQKTVFHRIVEGADGYMWFTELGLNQLGKVKIVDNPDPLVTGTNGAANASASAATFYNSGTASNLGFANPFPGFIGEVRVASGPFRNDGSAFTVAAAGPGGGPAIAIINSKTGAVTNSFFAFDPGFTGGVNIALADFNLDGVLDIIAAAGAGGGPQVNIYDGSSLALLKSFWAFDSAFTGGVNVSAADINGDNIPEIVVGAGAGGGPEVRVINYNTLAVLNQWYAYPVAFTGGVYVAVGDLGGNGQFEVLTGAGAGGTPMVAVWNALTGVQLTQFLAYSSGFSGGVRVGVSDANGDGTLDIITGAGQGGGPQVNAFNYPTLDLIFSFYSGSASSISGVWVS